MLIFVIVSILILLTIFSNEKYQKYEEENKIKNIIDQEKLKFNEIIKIPQTNLYGPISKDLFDMYSYELIIENNGTKTLSTKTVNFIPRLNLTDTYREIGNFDNSQNTLIIEPSLTVNAYKLGGFYDYFRDECSESCLTVKIENIVSMYTASRNAVNAFYLLNYDITNDIQVDQNPEILQKYDKIILLHNEYVTKKMFDAITSHPKVIYLYPNALYAQVDIDYTNNTMTLVRGHGYPESDIDNGFDWKFDNTRPDEFDNECLDWKFKQIDNGWMLNCYPENSLIPNNKELFKQIKGF